MSAESWCYALSKRLILMDIDPELALRAMREALQKYPGFEAYGPKLIAHTLFQGHALMLEYAVQPPRDDPDAWEFQHSVVKRYQSLAGVP
jgi:hypothetical protein